MKIGDRVYWTGLPGLSNDRVYGTIKALTASNKVWVMWDICWGLTEEKEESLQVLTVLDLILEAVDA